jgi:Rrf2 family iron-sulfur cluster assembly transcriptional regulator
VADIVTAVDEPLDATQCGGKENCHDEKRCMTHDLWATLNEKMHDYLSSVSLADLVAHQSGKPVAVIKDFRQHEKQHDKPAEEKVAA